MCDWLDRNSCKKLISNPLNYPHANIHGGWMLRQVLDKVFLA